MMQQMIPTQVLSSTEFDRLQSAYRTYVETLPQIEESSFLSMLDDCDRESLRLFATERTCVSGEVILREDQAGDCMYLIRRGTAVVFKGDVYSPMIIAARGEGGLIGEMTLIEKQPRSATVVALEPLSLWCISNASFLQLSSRSPAFSLKLLGLLSSRLRETDERYKEILSNGKQRDEILEALRDQVLRDPLTGLYNRRYLETILAQKIPPAEQGGNETGILMLDVDHFKQVNDTYGHPAGDAVLQALAKLVLERIRAEDIACRFGGEEFVVILPGAPLDVVRERAEVIRRDFQATRVAHQGLEITVTLSIGAAMCPADGRDGAAVLACADRALYQAKEEGRNRVVAWRDTR